MVPNSSPYPELQSCNPNLLSQAFKKKSFSLAVPIHTASILMPGTVGDFEHNLWHCVWWLFFGRTRYRTNVVWLIMLYPKIMGLIHINLILYPHSVKISTSFLVISKVFQVQSYPQSMGFVHPRGLITRRVALSLDMEATGAPTGQWRVHGI